MTTINDLTDQNRDPVSSSIQAYIDGALLILPDLWSTQSDNIPITYRRFLVPIFPLENASRDFRTSSSSSVYASLPSLFRASSVITYQIQKVVVDLNG